MEDIKSIPDGLVICISGNIGAGKTTLGYALAERLNVNFMEEPINMELLGQFLGDPIKYAYAFQLYMLTRRQLNYAVAIENKKYNKTTIIDRSLRCDKVFAELQHAAGRITDSEIDVYKKVYADFYKFIPDIVIHLDVSTDVSMQRIAKRERGCESTYTREYITELTNQYNGAIAEMESNGIKVIKLDWNEAIDIESPDELNAVLIGVISRIAATIKDCDKNGT